MKKLILDFSVLSDVDKQLLNHFLDELNYFKSVGIINQSTTNVIIKDITEYIYLKSINRKDD